MMVHMSAIREESLVTEPAVIRRRIGVLVESRYRSQRQPAGVIAALRRRGHLVTVVDPATHAVDLTDPRWCDSLDLVLCRGRSPAVVALLAMAGSRGVPCINVAAAVTLVLNKATAGAALAAAGIPVPPTFVGAPQRLADEETLRPPMILKPICGDNAVGLRIVRSREQLLGLDWPEGAALVQGLVKTDGTDLKLYGAGDQVWAVRRDSPIDHTDGARRRGTPTASPALVTPELAELAHRCRAVTGLELYGVDCAVSPDGPVVIEVNDFPNYTGVEDGDDGLADYVLTRARG